jgi:tetratricopeptide (TPR) repeat protein
MKNIFLPLLLAALLFGCSGNKNGKEAKVSSNKADDKTNSALLEKANEKLNQKDYKGALTDYQKVLETDPKNAFAYNGSGLCKYKLDDSTGAIKDLNKAIQLKPDYAMAYYNRAVYKFQYAKYKGAIQDFDKVAQLNPDFVLVYSNRGVCKYKLADFQGAINDYNKSIELNPGHGVVYYNRGMATLAMKNPKLKAGACNDFQKAIDLGYTQASDAKAKFCK